LQSTTTHLIAVLCFFGIAVASVGENRVQAETASLLESVQVGLDGTWKVGFDTTHRVVFSPAVRNQTVELQLQTVDGDGVTVVYRDSRWKITLEAGKPSAVSLVARHGRSSRPIVVRVLDHDSKSLLEQRTLAADERGTAIPAEQPWVVGIGNRGMQLDTAGMRSVAGTLGDYSTSELTSATSIPESSAGFHGVDLLVFSSSNRALIESLTEEQTFAISDWVLEGGRCALTLGSNADAWFQIAPFARLVPGTFSGVAERCSPGPLESFLNSQSPLKPISSAIVQLDSQQVPELFGQTPERNRYPLVAKWSIGLGKVRYLATELDSNAIRAWEGQTAMMKLLVNDQWEVRSSSLKNSAVEDLSVQLNSTLDRYDELKIGDLTQMSAILGVLLLILGPVDYFLIAKRWRKPRATWVTLLLVSVGCCCLLISLQRRWKPTSPSLNYLEIVNIDVESRRIKGHAYAHMYAGKRGEFQLGTRPNPEGMLGLLQSGPQNGSSNSTKRMPKILLDWFGQPGKSLGGFDSTIATDRILPPYEIVRSIQNSGSSMASIQSQWNSLGIPEAGTKAIECSWTDDLAESLDFSKLENIPGAIDLLNGSVTNALPVDLLNGQLLYRGRFYSLPLKIRPGERSSFSVTIVPKDLTRKLQRRINVDGKDQSAAWNSSDTSNLKRLAEILAFHRSAGGSSYTGMIHRYLAHLDHSELLRTDRAILFAELEKPQLAWQIQRNSVDVDTDNGTQATFVRIVLPVAKPSKNTSQKLDSE
jgi:hypothetical protein